MVEGVLAKTPTLELRSTRDTRYMVYYAYLSSMIFIVGSG